MTRIWDDAPTTRYLSQQFEVNVRWSKEHHCYALVGETGAWMNLGKTDTEAWYTLIDLGHEAAEPDDARQPERVRMARLLGIIPQMVIAFALAALLLAIL
jgi:hypothetical protein